jgi:hypothetical protein
MALPQKVREIASRFLKQALRRPPGGGLLCNFGWRIK